MGPLVSVIVTTYNLGWCIEDTIRCILGQTYGNIEIIVVDDASTDDTPARMAPFIDRVKYIRHPTNQGIAMQAEGGPARNTGIRQAAGEFIAFLDGDDLWEPEKIAVQVDVARRFPQAGLIAVDGVAFDHDSSVIIRPTLFNDQGDMLCSSLAPGSELTVDLYQHFLRGCVFDTPSQVMVPATALRTIGEFAQFRADDYDFCLRLTARFDVVLVKKSLVRYRCHTSSVSGAVDMQYFRFAQPNLAIWRKHLNECRPGAEPFIRQQMKDFLTAVATRALQRGQRGHRSWASQFLWSLLVKNPGTPGSTHVALCLARVWIPGRVDSMLRRMTSGLK